MTSEHPHTALLKKYRDTSNRHDIEACVAMFTKKGVIVPGGESYSGVAALWAVTV